MTPRLRSSFVWVAAVIALGAPSARAQTVLRSLQCGGGQSGASVAMVGDVDADGVPDIAVGSPRNTQSLSEQGAVTLFSLATGTELWSAYGGATSDQLGTSVAGIGDVNHDGVPDVAAGAPVHTGPALRTGQVRLLSGFDGSVLRLIDGPFIDAQFGLSLAGIGDWNGDGTPDVLVGSEQCGARVLSGATGLSLFQLHGSGPDPRRYGFSLAALGDWTGDGRTEIAVGSPLDSTVAVSAGAVDVFDGTGTLLFTRRGSVSTEYFGTSVAAMSDVDLDGVPELIAGGIEPSSGGVVRIHAGLTGTLLRQVNSLDSFEAFGSSVAGIGDVDGDLVGDFAVGAPAFEIQVGTGAFLPDVGAVRFYSGADGRVLDLFTRGTSQMRTGTAVVPCADVDADGLADVAISEPGAARVVVVSAASLSAIDSFCFGDGSAAPCPCGNVSPAASGGCLNSTGHGGLLSSTGSPRIAGTTLSFQVTQVPATTTAIFFQGSAETPPSFSADGLLCAGGLIRRLVTRAASGGGIVYPQPATAQIATLGMVQAGVQYVYQVRYRNNAGPCGQLANLTNGLRVVWSP